jgi:hypothetical protein
MIDMCVSLVYKFNLSMSNGCNIYIDGSHNAFVRQLKKMLGDNPDYDGEIDRYRHNMKDAYSLNLLRQYMLVVPINFGTEHKHLLSHCKEALEYNGGTLAIHPSFTKLTTALRTAQEKGELSLDKEHTSYHHLLDGLRMALQYYH